jgi:hypothetical protein
MFNMRYFINLADSYQDDTKSVEAAHTESDLNLVVGSFKKEDLQLTDEFHIDDPAVQAAVMNYTHESTINSELIRVDGQVPRMPESFQDEYKLLMSLKGTPLGENHQTYCGTGTFNPMEVTSGGIFQTPAFMSTSLSIRVAVKTTNGRRENAEEVEDHVLHFVLPKGYEGGFYVAPYSRDPEELEYLIFPKEHFRHIKTEIRNFEDVKRHIHSFRPA